jgi:hypothetical protein
MVSVRDDTFKSEMQSNDAESGFTTPRARYYPLGVAMAEEIMERAQQCSAAVASNPHSGPGRYLWG